MWAVSTRKTHLRTRGYVGNIGQILCEMECSQRCGVMRAKCVCVDVECPINGQEVYQYACWQVSDLYTFSVCGASACTSYGRSFKVFAHIHEYIDGIDVPFDVFMRQMVFDDVARDGCSSKVGGVPYACMYSESVCFDGPYLPHWVLHPVHTSECITS